MTHGPGLKRGMAVKTKIKVGLVVKLLAGFQSPTLVEWTVTRVTRTSVYLAAPGHLPQRVSRELVAMAIARSNRGQA